MTCTNCRDRIERKLLASDGVRAARVSFEKNEAGGCNPMPIAYEAGEGTLRVKADELERYADRFTSWGGRTE